jgi:putative addiction module component (TIGR02574 family)
MASVDFRHLTTQERLDLIGEIWDSIEAERVPLTSAQTAELDRRYVTLDDDIKKGRDAFSVYDDLTARYR